MNLILAFSLKSTLSEEKFWVALSSIITALALFYTITRNLQDNMKKKHNLKKSLQIELVTNVDSIFSGGVDRPLLFDSIKTLRKTYINEAKDREILGILQRLYLELQHYAIFVEKVYLTNSGIDRRYVTERQLQTCNIFLKHFGLKPIEYNVDRLNHADIGNQYIEDQRNKASKIKEEKFSEWSELLRKEIEKLL
jgi:hypothetical protein